MLQVDAFICPIRQQCGGCSQPRPESRAFSESIIAALGQTSGNKPLVRDTAPTICEKCRRPYNTSVEPQPAISPGARCTRFRRIHTATMTGREHTHDAVSRSSSFRVLLPGKHKFPKETPNVYTNHHYHSSYRPSTTRARLDFKSTRS